MKPFFKIFCKVAFFCAVFELPVSSDASVSTDLSAKMDMRRLARPVATRSQNSVPVGASISVKPLSPTVYASPQNADMDWWFKIPADSGPHVADIKKVFYGQNFNVFSFVSNASEKDGNFRLKYSLKLKCPDTSVVPIVENVPFTGRKPASDVILALPDVASLRFDEKYPDKKYVLELVVTDEISNKTASSSADVWLYKWSAPNPFSDKAEVYRREHTFFNEPSPENLHAIFFSKDFDLEQKGAPYSVNFSRIGFLRAAFAENKFLLPYIRAQFKTAKPTDRAKIIFLFHILDEQLLPPSDLKPAEQSYSKRLGLMKLPDPYAEWDPVLAAAQVDLLWGEFYANGTYKPLRRILDLIAMTDQAAFADSLIASKKRPQNGAEWKNFMLGMASRAALSTLAVNSQRIPLVEKYARWAIENNDIPERGKKVLFGGEPSAPVESSKSNTTSNAKFSAPNVPSATLPSKKSAK